MIEDKTRKQLKIVAQYLKEKLGEELTKQGHKATGRLLESIKVEVKDLPDRTILEGSFEDYGKFLDTGVKNVRPGRAYIEAIVNWLRLKGIQAGDKSLLSIAFAIRATHLKQGIPTSKSRRFSQAKGNRRIGWMTETLNEQEQQIGKMIDDAYFVEMNVIVDNFVRKSNKILN